MLSPSLHHQDDDEFGAIDLVLIWFRLHQRLSVELQSYLRSLFAPLIHSHDHVSKACSRPVGKAILGFLCMSST